MARKSDAMLGFDALSIEGGLLSPVWLGKVAQLQAGGQEPGDYGIPKGLTVRDEIGRYWRIAQAHWSEFKAGGSADPRALAERFITAFLGEVLGFASLASSVGTTVGDRTWPVRHSALGGRVPVIIAPAGEGLETPDAAFGDDGRRRTAFGLLQEFLNAEDRGLWGIATDGRTLRIARDNASLTRPAWIEADLASIFADERYADFATLWLLAHESRFGAADRPPTDCPLETWRNAGGEEGTRARERLREGVEDALLALSNGFLSHAGNHALRESLRTNALTRDAFFQQLLRLVYRLIFLITAEERGVLHVVRDTAETRRYAEGYGLRRLRERSVRRSAHDRFSDLWQGLLIVLRGLAAGEARLALPALAGLFARDQCIALDAASLENRALLQAVYRLCWLRDDAGLVRVNWRDMGPEELGSVYESLLELVPRISPDGRTFSFAAGDETKGNARKSSGSYYTPDSLVQVLLDSALDPVIADTIAKNPGNAIETLLGLSIVDPACGSGHFLLAAARRLAAQVARLEANGTPSAAEFRHALRQVVGRCIFGVDLNPMAVELCKVGLWMEAVEPGLPLTFLNSHIQHGNALLGTTPELMAKGIPDAAWDPIEGDDKKTASALKKRNKKAAEGQRSLDTLWSKAADREAQAVTRAVAELDAASDANVEALTKKEERWDGILGSPEYRHQKFVADAWCSAFVWPKQPGELADAAPTNELWRQLRDGQGKAPALTTTTVGGLADQYRFFHWHLQFPQVFAKGGFDVVLGNPPWERLTLRDQEWFASRDPNVASAKNAADRRRKIEELVTAQPELLRAFQRQKRASLGEKTFSRQSGYFPLAGVGDVNTFALFAETAQRLAARGGSAGLIVPSGVATTDTTKAFFAHLVTERKLHALFDFDNRGGLFPAVQGNVRFCLLVTSGHANNLFQVAAQLTDTAALRDNDRVYELSGDDIARINPGTLTCPLFLTRRDAQIIGDIYRHHPVLEKEEGAATAGWHVSLSRMLHMGDDADDFRTEAQLRDGEAKFVDGHWVHPANGVYLPLYESKLCSQYNHRAATFEGIPEEERFGTHPATRAIPYASLADPALMPVPRYWAPRSRAVEWAGEHRLVLAFRNAVSATADARSINACLMPVYPAGDSLKFIRSESAEDLLILVALLNSFVVDFVFRQKATGANASFFLIRQLPVLAKGSVTKRAPWANEETVRDWIASRVRELSCTSNDMRLPVLGGSSFAFDEERRALLGAELDAAVLHLYGLNREDVEYVLESFPVFRRADVAAHGEYRTKRIVLEMYDAMAEAARTGKPYQTRLSPPPADPRVAHPPREGGKVISLPVKPAARPQPASPPAAAAVSDLAAIAANAWTRPHTIERGEIQAAILAVVKANGAPMDCRQARLAALLCLEPHLLAPMLEKGEKAEWTRVVGDDAKKAPRASIDTASQEWGAALTGLRGRGRLLEDLQRNTWALGTGTDAIDTSGWPEGRAGFVVNVLRRLQPSTQVDALILKLPLNVQKWLANAA